ncbi:MAG TPA: molybdenum cofactor guanylyltransferase [Longimicrobiales bacterium]|nr:molybdenum cofactor guanylyltransferase [Longimicrobiales bacterium]
MTRLRLLGAVLAGGEGRRYGGPKGDVLVGGTPMVVRAVDALRPWVDDVVVVASRAPASAPARVIPDRVAGAGPLGGLDAALGEASALGLDGVFLLACDLPLVTAEVVGSVIGLVGAAAAAAPARAPSGVEPLCAVYRVGVHPTVRERLSATDRSLHALFRDVGGTVVPAERLGGAGAVFLNVNTPSDRHRAEAGPSHPEEVP